MPCDYHINADAGLVTITGSLEVGLPEAIRLGRALIEDQQFDSELPHLVDLRGLVVNRSSAESEKFRDFVLLEYSRQVRSAVAVVVDESLDQTSLAALYHLTSRVVLGELFDDYNLALRWLMRREFASRTESNTPHRSG